MLRFILLAWLLVFAAHADTHFLTISDIHYGSNNTSDDGADAGDKLLSLTVNKIKELSKDVAFILYLGDLPSHLLGYSPAKAGYEKTLFHALFAADVYKKPMFYIPGNNDSIAGNYQPFQSNGKSPLDYAEDWNGACVYCEDLLIDAAFMRSGGYYSSYVLPHNKDLILIVLNATQWMVPHFFLPNYPNQDKDAEMQLDWLQKQLQSHHAKQVLIAMHQPPGNDYRGNAFWKQPYLARFINILKQNQKNYENTTLITSHTHMDEMRKIVLDGNKAIYAFSTPAVSRIYHNNSAMKIFELNSKMQMKDYTTYYTPTNQEWGGLHYRAVGGLDAIFPGCQNKIVPKCLDELSLDQVCNYIEQGQFYGVKSPRVTNKPCRLMYRVALPGH